MSHTAGAAKTRVEEAPLRILTVMARPLYPADTGGRIRSSKIFERLSQIHHLTTVCFRRHDDAERHFEQMRACCSRLETVEWTETAKFTPGFYRELASSLLSPLPYTVWKYRSAAMTKRIQELLHSGQYDLLLCDFLQPSVNCLEQSFRPKVLFQHNVEAVIRRRQVEHADNPVARAYLWQEARKLRRFEQRAARTFDHCIMVSDADCRTMEEQYGVFNTSSIPTGVDVDYFRSGGPESGDPSMVFVGSMDWLPNQDAVEWFVSSVLPLVRREVDARFIVVGRNPPKSIRALSGHGVQVTGTVDDVRPYVANAQVCLVPMRIGGGTRIKIFEAMAMGKTVVSTPIGAEGLPVTHEQDILLAVEPRELAALVVRALKDVELRKRIGEAGRRLVSERYTWDVSATCFSEICRDVVRHTGSTRP